MLTSGRTSFSLLWSGDFTGTEDPLGRGIQRLRSPGTIVLGALVGTAEFEGDILRARICKIENLLEKLLSLEDPQSEFCILRSCFSLPKLSFALRTVDTSSHTLLLHRFDDSIRRAFEGIIGAPLGDSQVLQASLPVSMGGYWFETGRTTWICSVFHKRKNG